MMQTKPPLDEPRLLVAVVPAGVCASKGWGDQDHGFTTVGMLFFRQKRPRTLALQAAGLRLGSECMELDGCVCVCACVTRQA